MKQPQNGTQDLSPSPGPEVRSLLERARHFALEGKHDDSLRLNEEALAAATTPGERALALRWIGVCHHYLEQPLASETHLTEALELARSHGWVVLEHFLLNHLGASLRRQGRLDDALTVFETALRTAVGQPLVEARARLWGNIGALWDELGQRSRADDAYARFEELVRILPETDGAGHASYLVNALGLSGRAALLRRDIDGAVRHVEEAEALVTRHNLHGRRIDIAKQHAEIALARAQALLINEAPAAGDHETREQEARRHLEQAGNWHVRALEAIGTTSKGHRQISLLKGHSKCALLQDDLPAAYGRLCEAQRLASDLRSSEEIASVAEAQAELCAAAGLEGEALWHLSSAITVRREAYQSLRNGAVRALARPRFDAIQVLARRLLTSARSIHVSDSERATLETVLAHAGVSPGQSLTTSEVSLQDSSQLRVNSERRWRRLLGRCFDLASPATRDDLVRADVVYHGAVDDLARSAHLLLVVLERELRKRVHEPIKAEADSRSGGGDPDASRLARDLTRVTLINGLQVINRLRSAKKPAQPSPGSFREHILRRLAPISELLQEIEHALKEPTPTVDGSSSLSLLDVRNQIAHGEATVCTTRLSVDVVRRRLTLDRDTLLRRVLEIEPV